MRRKPRRTWLKRATPHDCCLSGAKNECRIGPNSKRHACMHSLAETVGSIHVQGWDASREQLVSEVHAPVSFLGLI
jgi:hypothetical protein